MNNDQKYQCVGSSSLWLIGDRRWTMCVAVALTALASPAGAQCVEHVETAELLASDSQAADILGVSVSISGSEVVVGAPGDDHAGGTNAGAVYIYRNTGGFWTQVQKLVASDAAAGDDFGTDVAIFRDRIIVGAPGDDVGIATDRGSAYVFIKTGSTWAQEAKLSPPDGATGDAFGRSVSLRSPSTTLVAVGAPLDDNTGPSGTTGGTDAGSVYVYSFTGFPNSSWTFVEKIMASDGIGNDGFGTDVCIQSTTLLAGAPRVTTNLGLDAGAGYVFTSNASGTTWSQQVKLVASDGGLNHKLGSTVSLSGETAVLGAPYEGPNPSSDVGAVYFFDRSAGIWSEGQKFRGPAIDSRFGSAIDISGNTAVVGCPEYTFRRGTYFFFRREGGVWTYEATVPGLLGFPEFEADFGSSVALGSERVVVGAPNRDVPGTSNAGAAFVYDVVPRAPVTLTPLPPTTVTCSTGMVSLQASATGYPPLTWSWQFRGGPGGTPEWSNVLTGPNLGPNGVAFVAGATDGPALSLTPGPTGWPAELPPYEFRARARNFCGIVSGDPTRLQVCPADFTCDGGVDSDDVIAFFGAWDRGEISADFNADGGVDSDDVIGFFGRWDAGC